jgi:hypothetical protein
MPVTLRQPTQVTCNLLAQARQMSADRRGARRFSVLQTVYVFTGGTDISDTILKRDGACLHLSGYDNGQNCGIWNPENLLTLHERPLHSLTVEV